MRPSDDLQREAVAADARRWLGTPYHHHARIFGVGVDCVNMACAVYEACGLIPATDPGHYPHDWHLHRDEERIRLAVEAAGGVLVDAPRTGDLALFRFGRTFSHAGIVVDGAERLIVHAYIGLGVILTRAGEAPLARPALYYSLWRA